MQEQAAYQNSSANTEAVKLLKLLTKMTTMAAPPIVEAKKIMSTRQIAVKVVTTSLPVPTQNHKNMIKYVCFVVFVHKYKWIRVQNIIKDLWADS